MTERRSRDWWRYLLRVSREHCLQEGSMNRREPSWISVADRIIPVLFVVVLVAYWFHMLLAPRSSKVERM